MKTVIRDSSVSENGFTLRYLLFEVAENGRTDYLFNVEIHSDRVDDAEQVSDVCETRDEAISLFVKMVEGCATPASLSEIAEDYIFEKTFVPYGTVIGSAPYRKIVTLRNPSGNSVPTSYTYSPYGVGFVFVVEI